MREKILSIVRRDSIAVLWRQRYGSDGKHCLGPRQLLFGSDEGSETPNSAPLKSKECFHTFAKHDKLTQIPQA